MNQKVKQLLQGKGSNYILPFLWVHGEEKAVLQEYMGAIHASGIGAVCIESGPHPDYCGPKRSSIIISANSRLAFLENKQVLRMLSKEQFSVRRTSIRGVDTITNRLIHWSYSEGQKEEPKLALRAGISKYDILNYFYPDTTVEEMQRIRNELKSIPAAN